MPFENAYSGFTLKGAGEKEAAVPRVAVADISPKDFFKRFVAPRRPCILTGQLEGSNFAAWSNAYLKKKAGDSFVDVEHRESAKERYGKGKSQRIKFKDFMDKFAAKDDTLYMTTQELQNDAVGMPERMGNPAACLVGDFPARPALMGHLAPSTYTLWMGHNKEESSSGLHHDFHDNLYVLLRGTKRFRLFSPDDTDRMYTHGEVANVHPNGRICYKGAETDADGSDEATRRAMLAAHKQAHAMVEVASAEAAVQAGEKGAATRLEKAEAALDDAMDEALDAEMEMEGASDGEHQDDDEESEDEDGPSIFSMRPADLKRPPEHRDGGGASQKKAKRGKAPESEEESEEEEEEEEGGASSGGGSGGGKAARKPITTADPQSFSRVDPARPAKELKKKFPLFSGATEATCLLAEGEMLFLPAGWFHEVCSLAGDKGHAAFNYWFQPPDAASFAKPYSRSMWEEDIAARPIGA